MTAEIHHRTSRRKNAPPWQQLAPRFTRDEDCVASFLAYETAEIIDGVKPGNLINLSDRNLPCGRNMYRLWESYGEKTLAPTGLEVRVLRKQTNNMLLFVFRRSALQELVERRPVRALLRAAGYPDTVGLEALLDELGERLSPGSFPHEIGLFLGYPPKDVAAFMGLASIPFTCQGPWKIYGNPQKSLHIAELHRNSRCRMALRLARTGHPHLCLLNRPARHRASILAA